MHIMEMPEDLVHHQTIRCSARGEVRRSANWDRVTCEDCWNKRESNNKGAVIFGLVFAGFAFLLMITCMAVLI